TPPLPPRALRSPPFPYTTLFRSKEPIRAPPVALGLPAATLRALVIVCTLLRVSDLTASLHRGPCLFCFNRLDRHRNPTLRNVRSHPRLIHLNNQLRANVRVQHFNTQREHLSSETVP